MSILDYAMKMEQDGEAFYRELAEKTSDKGLKAIFTMMADEEHKHFAAFAAIKQGAPAMPESETLTKVPNIFEELKDENGGQHFGKDAVEQYRKLLQIEQMSEGLYRAKADEEDDPAVKALLNRIADEERRHATILGNMVEMVERPQRWIENAEWRNSADF